MARALLGLALIVSLSALSLSADGAQDKKDDKKPGVFTDPKDAGPDFLVQGEYQGEAAGKKLGAQVVALGDGAFDVYFLSGGLPGAGWDTKGRTKAQAKTEGGKRTLSGGGYSGSIAEGLIACKTPEGVEYTLKRTLRQSPTLGAHAPAGAIVLFDGSSADQWKGGKLVEDRLLSCGTSSVKGIGPGKLHIEFRTPFQPKQRGQGRGNSGVYVHGSEVQVLDSFGLTGAANECGAFYGKAKPAVNMCLPPLSWQTYDIEIRDDKGNTVATVLHNGVPVHENFMIHSGVPKAATINLQNHGNPVVYRNIWFVEAK